MGMQWQYVRNDDEVLNSDSPFLITNFERIREGNINPRLHDFAGMSIDEGQALRDLGSDTYQVFADVFADVPFRFVCSATPSPNNYIELLNYAEFLGVMDRGQALTRWFKRDSTHAGHLTLHPHHEKEFWMWVASWALFLYRPSDVGFSDEGYALPELRVHYHRVAVDQSRAWAQTDSRGQHRLFLDAAGGVDRRFNVVSVDVQQSGARDIFGTNLGSGEAQALRAMPQHRSLPSALVDQNESRLVGTLPAQDEAADVNACFLEAVALNVSAKIVANGANIFGS